MAVKTSHCGILDPACPFPPRSLTWWRALLKSLVLVVWMCVNELLTGANTNSSVGPQGLGWELGRGGRGSFLEQ